MSGVRCIKFKIQHSKSNIPFSLPWINSFSYYDYDKAAGASKSGFAGYGFGIFYKQDKNKFSLNAAFVADLPFALGAIDYVPEGIRTSISTQFAEALFQRRVYKKVGVIAGVNFTGYYFQYISYVTGYPSYDRHDQSAGITLGTEYMFTKNISLAAIYRPALFSFDTKHYRHLLSLDARFDINLWKKRK
jgi:hypothetical protein